MDTQDFVFQCWRLNPPAAAVVCLLQLAYCVVQFLEKDSTLTEPVRFFVGSLTRPWLFHLTAPAEGFIERLMLPDQTAAFSPLTP